MTDPCNTCLGRHLQLAGGFFRLLILTASLAFCLGLTFGLGTFAPSFGLSHWFTFASGWHDAFPAAFAFSIRPASASAFAFGLRYKRAVILGTSVCCCADAVAHMSSELALGISQLCWFYPDLLSD